MDRSSSRVGVNAHTGAYRSAAVESHQTERPKRRVMKRDLELAEKNTAELIDMPRSNE
jgi:hypothetical protein